MNRSQYQAQSERTGEPFTDSFTPFTPLAGRVRIIWLVHTSFTPGRGEQRRYTEVKTEPAVGGDAMAAKAEMQLPSPRQHSAQKREDAPEDRQEYQSRFLRRGGKEGTPTWRST